MSSALKKSLGKCAIVCALWEPRALLSKHRQSFGLRICAVSMLIGDTISKLVETTCEKVCLGDRVDVDIWKTLLQADLGVRMTSRAKRINGDSECSIE